jgi:hypothetical protein
MERNRFLEAIAPESMERIMINSIWIAMNRCRTDKIPTRKNNPKKSLW